MSWKNPAVCCSGNALGLVFGRYSVRILAGTHNISVVILSVSRLNDLYIPDSTHDTIPSYSPDDDSAVTRIARRNNRKQSTSVNPKSKTKWREHLSQYLK
jgi:hypothetical protein